MADWSTESGSSNESRTQQPTASDGSNYDWTDADWSFFDDLVAANNFKTFLVGRGIDIDKAAREGIARLLSDYEGGVRAVRTHVLYGRKRRIRWLPSFRPLPVERIPEAQVESRS